MPRRRNGQRSLAREGEPSEKTPNSDLEVPVPTRDEFFGLLGKAATTPPDEDDTTKRRSRTTGKRRS
jgi:hypothetical protein